MKLTWRIVIRISLLMSVVLAVWAVLFHNTVIDEVNDETDDSLEFFSENLISRVLRGEKLPAADNGTNNTYFLDSISEEYALMHPNVVYSNEIVYIKEKNEDEPARVLRTVFQDTEGKYHQLTVATPTIDTDDLREALTSWIVMLYAALLVLTAAACLWVLWRSMRPLYRILRWLNTNDISKGVQPLDNPSRMSEFIKLNEAIVSSARRSEQLYTQQKQFTGNASHEIQTPLAVCKNRLDLLLETSLTEEQMGEVIKVQQTLDNISRMNKDLLLLAKIDGGQFTETASVDMAALASKVAEDCGMAYCSAGAKVSVNVAGSLNVEMNPTMASVLVTNLVKNAFLHNLKDGSIYISFVDGSLCVANSGETPLNADQVFERFYQGSKREGSTGLGLAIVKAIAGLYGFGLQYEFKDARHIFSIKFR